MAHAMAGADGAAPADPPGAVPLDRIALAWRLKRQADLHWAANPARTRACTRAVRAVADATDDRLARPALDALGAWACGVEALMSGHPQDAAAQFEASADALERLALYSAAAEVRVPAIAALAMTGRHEAAARCAERVLPQLLAAGDVRGAGKVHLNLASMRMRQDRYPEAAEGYRRAAVCFARADEPTHSIMADIGLATALTGLHDFAEAASIAERARRRALSRDLRPLLAIVHSTLGRLHLLVGAGATALHWLEQALRDAEALGRPQSLAEARRNLADGFLHMGLRPEAARLYGEALAVTQSHVAPVEQAWIRLQRAEALAGLGASGEARAELDRADGLFHAQGNALGQARVALLRALLALNQGDAGAAGRHADAAAATFDGLGLEAVALEAVLVRAEAALAAGQGSAAAPTFEAVAAHPGARLPVRAAAWAAAASAWVKAGQPERAERPLQQALALHDAQMQSLADDGLRRALGVPQHRAFELAVTLALRARTADDADPTAVQTVLARADRARGRALRGASAPRSFDDPVLADLRARLDWCERETATAMAQGQVERVKALRASGLALEQRWQQHQLRLRVGQLDGRSAAAGASPMTSNGNDSALLEQVRQALGDDEALVLYHLDLPEAWAVVVRPGSARAVVLDAASLVDRLDSLQFQLEALRYPAARHGPQAPALLARVRSHLQVLHRILWAPLQSMLADRAAVVVVPHGPLHRLPFAALHDGTGWLVERHAVALAPALRGWADLPRWRWPERARVALLAASAGLGAGEAALPHVARELDGIATALAGRAQVRQDRQVSRDTFAAAVADAQVVHLACHGAFRGDNPDFSHLLLSDGPMTLEALARLRLQDALVVLSSCESGAGAAAPGDEVLGLVRGLWRAGARHAVSSLWAVDDEATASLMAVFHAGLAAGASPARALAQAQRQTAPRWPHPFHWAAFTLHGRD